MADVRPIDANALKDAFYTDVQTAMFSWNTDLLQVLMIEIDEAPTLEYAPVVHAEWVWDDDGFCRCSHCKQKAPVVPQSNDEPITMQTDYCPNCGAKMDGGKRND